jgi:hypothetical protein
VLCMDHAFGPRLYGSRQKGDFGNAILDLKIQTVCSGGAMGISHRMFLIDSEDRLYRLPTSTFQAMLQAPALRRYRQFAGQRIRTASICIELIDRQPTEIVRATFDILTFDADGYLERDLYLQQQSSRAERAMAPVIFDLPSSTDVVDAASRFIAHGGCWIPSGSLARAIEDAALARTRCMRL